MAPCPAARRRHQARRGCSHYGRQRPLKDRRSRRLRSLFGTVEVRAPRFEPCRCSVTLRTTISPVTEIMPDRCTPEYERVLAKLGALLPYRRARALLEDFFSLGDPPAIDTIQQRTLQVGARLERGSIVAPASAPAAEAAETITLAIDSGHVRAVRSYQVRTFEVFVAQASNDDGKQIAFSSVPVEADRQTQQLRGLLRGLGATPCTEVTILSDGAAPMQRRAALAWRGGVRWSGQSCARLVPSRNAYPTCRSGGQRLAGHQG